MVYNTKIKNKVFYDESTGGSGDWEFSINTSGLETAAGEYGAAAEAYNKALADVTEKLNSALNLWQDKSAETWKAKVNAAQTNLQAVSAAMTVNTTVLNEIATAALTTESNVANGIASI